MILVGHPSGNPNSHHAALAHYEAGWLEAFCVPWMPTPRELARLQRLPGLSRSVARLQRRCFKPLLPAPRIEGRVGEWLRLLQRAASTARGEERFAYAANDWLMRTMRREVQRPSVTAVYSYEDCSLWQFEEATRLSKCCIYDMPIGYYPAWEETETELARRHSDWVGPRGLSSKRYLRPMQKRKEMELADLVLAPSSFVRQTIHRFVDTAVAVAPFGVDLDFWAPPSMPRASSKTLRFIYAGQCSLRKGIPLLLAAWRAANLKNATLQLVGSWQFTSSRLRELSSGVEFAGPVSSLELRNRYHAADVFVFPSYFEGFGLVLLEAMACGLPAIATDATAAPDVLNSSCGHQIPAGNLDALVESLRWFGQHRERLAAMSDAATARAAAFTWTNYRNAVRQAVGRLVAPPHTAPQ